MEKVKIVMEDNMPKSCQEIALLSEKKQYKEASFWERLRIKMHILYCERCRNYEKDNKQLSSILNDAKLDSLSDEEREELEKIIK
jgi:hypothetical protein